MEERVVRKERLTDFIRDLAEDWTIVGPVVDRAVLRYRTVDDPAGLRLESGRGVVSAKGAVFPQTEILFRFSNGATEVPSEPDETLLFGVRPCDARAMTLLDRVSRSHDIDDPYVVARRETTAVVALACNAPGPACFCTSVGGGPADSTGSDLLLIELGDRFLVRPVTDRGAELLGATEKTTEPASEADIAAAEETTTRAIAEISPVGIPADLAALAEAFDGQIWDEIAATCLGCGACTYACPTCHCFDITDEARKGSGHRVRSWDSCAFSLFTLHGSGHNPRETRAARLRQRILHKFLYAPETLGEVFCVGCGRCIAVCPTGLDLRSMLERLVDVTSGGA